MHGQTNQTIQQWGDALKELQKSIASLANNSELQGKAMTSAKRYMTEVHGTFIQTLMQLMNEYTASFLLYKDGYYQIDTHNHAELPEDVYKGLHSDLGKSKQRFEQQLEQLTTAKLRIAGLVNYQGTSHTKTKFTYEKLMKDIKHLDESITQYEEMHARQDLQAFKELLDATKSLIAEHSSRDRSMGSYQVGDFLQLSSINRFMLAAQQSAVYLNDHMTQIQAAQEREQLRVESIYAEERSKQGAINLVFGVLTLIAGVSALVMSGGTMLPIVAAAFKVAAMATFMYGASNSIEAGQNIYYGLSGDGKSFAMNPIRDTIFLGNGELYHGFGQVFTLTTGVFIPIAQTQSIAQGISQFFWGTVGGLATGQAAYHGTKLLGGNEETAQLMNLIGNFIGGYSAAKAVENFSLNGKTVPKVESALEIENRVMENIKASKTARESSKFKQYIEKEGFQQTLNAMDPIDRQRYLQWHKYAEAGIEPSDRVKLSTWSYPPEPEFYLKNKNVYDNPDYFNQLTGDIIYPGSPESSMGKVDGSIHKNGFLNGEYVEDIIEPGTVLDRYGDNNSGRYFSPSGASFGERALPPFMKNKPKTTYIANKPIPNKKGLIAPWFDEPGMGIQHFTDMDVEHLVNNGYLIIIE